MNLLDMSTDGNTSVFVKETPGARRPICPSATLCAERNQVSNFLRLARGIGEKSLIFFAIVLPRSKVRSPEK